ncbi:MAG TPA: TetR/AcrR family transcriptional regulator [Terriglobales bacterium]|nr:TetR/AcrR family transcriptional regulator [Terriglobales bacterium]
MATTTHIRVAAEDRRQQIIDVAREMFADKGFTGTTTRELAEGAGINEALIFRHFESKEDLYWSVIQSIIDMRGKIERLRELLNAGLDERETLELVAREILNRNVQLTRLLFYSVLERHELSDRFFKTHAVEYHEIVAEYMSKRMRAGRFRSMDPLLAARSFIAMFAYHFQIQELFGGRHLREFEPSEVVRNLVDIWLSGMQRSKSKKTGIKRTRYPETAAR